MDIETIIANNTFSFSEKAMLRSIYRDLITINPKLIFEYKDSISCAKFRPSENKIILRCNDVYSTIIHELLHAKLLYNKEFPSFEDINRIKDNYRIPFCDKLIIDITNDMHHFLFYERFKSLTKNSVCPYFIKNQDGFRNIKEKKIINYFASNPVTVREKAYALINTYRDNFIPYKYNKLLFNEKKYVANECDFVEILPFETLYGKILSLNKSCDSIKEAYRVFLMELDNILNKK